MKRCEGCGALSEHSVCHDCSGAGMLESIEQEMAMAVEQEPSPRPSPVIWGTLAALSASQAAAEAKARQEHPESPLDVVL